MWAALIDPEVLRRLIPGCETMTGSPATGYDIAVAREVGGLTVRLTAASISATRARASGATSWRAGRADRPVARGARPASASRPRGRARA